ncbi:MAG: hypothetical protein R3B90_05780 [Planctomycetaceae bacterium]
MANAESIRFAILTKRCGTQANAVGIADGNLSVRRTIGRISQSGQYEFNFRYDD